MLFSVFFLFDYVFWVILVEYSDRGMRISTPAVQLVLDRRGDRRKALWLALISLVLFQSGVECRYVMFRYRDVRTYWDT